MNKSHRSANVNQIISAYPIPFEVIDFIAHTLWLGKLNNFCAIYKRQKTCFFFLLIAH